MNDEVQPLPFDPMTVVRNAPSMRFNRNGVANIGPLDEDLPEMLREVNGGYGRDLITLVGVLWGSTSQLFNRLGPLQQVADQMPTIVSHSDQVHSELQQGLDAIRTAVGAVQQAASSLGTSITPIAQLAAQAQAQAAIANAAASAAGQRCAALEARVATLEARKVQTWRAAGNLPTLALNATTPVSCPWTSAVPSPLPSVDQCQAFVASGSATPTVLAVSTAGVTVSLKALAALLPTAGAVQVQATTFS